ncbi:MAG: amino acid permease [Kofleriaceae bacterium]|nr:amino acid permease [Myxococcales bacterium]MCB9564444.1 amino acid permease [Kofleriaceae bacterium]MCB9573867.1 amino acid permease [Kofleriaceae bacterium]
MSTDPGEDAPPAAAVAPPRARTSAEVSAVLDAVAPAPARTIDLRQATGIGVGAIVGGGIMVLAGVAFQNAGPAAMIAFALNGVVALITAMSYAEIATTFPESGGTYTFAKKVLNVRAAFGVGWILWFAYIVAGVLYALGFATFTQLALHELVREVGGTPPAWLDGRKFSLLLATLATIAYALGLARHAAGGGQWAVVGKVVLFAVIIVAGVVALAFEPVSHSGDTLDPFFSGGGAGVITAMGYTFIAVQGFDLIPAVAGEVKEPNRTIPGAMFRSLAIAMAVYLPLLFVVSTAGVDAGHDIRSLALERGDTVFAFAVRRFMGVTGYWLIIIAAILSTLSALQANLMAASRVALSMAQDHTLPSVLARIHPERRTPLMAIYATTLTLIAIVFMVPDLGAAGAAASLIFLASFTLAHITTYLSRIRGGAVEGAYQTPWFPLIPAAGAIACAALAVFQAVSVPDAGGVVLIWLALGVLLYVALFKGDAETADASALGRDPQLAMLRGRVPLVLLPIANPAHARGMVEVANALAPSEYARVLLLTVVKSPRGAGADPLARLDDAQRVVGEALSTSYAAGQTPEALITAAADPWAEIGRIATEYECDSLLIGGLAKGEHDAPLAKLIRQLYCDVAVMRATPGWSLAEARKILVPLGGRGDEHELRARVLASLCRDGSRSVTFVRVLPALASDDDVAEVERQVAQRAEVKLGRRPRVKILRAADPQAALVELAASHDLILLGLHRDVWGRRGLSPFAIDVARAAPCPAILLSQRPSQLVTEVYRPLKDVVMAAPWMPRKPERAG